jgi:hypothetical protein
MLGGNGNGLMVNDTYKDVRGVTAFACVIGPPGYLILTYQDFRMELYSMGKQFELLKNFKNATDKKITILRALTPPKKCEGMIFLLAACEDKSVRVYRIEKAILTSFSIKMNKEIK